MRVFVLRARSAPTDSQQLLAAVGQAAHPEILAHTLMNAIFVAQAHRDDVVVHLVLESTGDFSRTISFTSNELGTLGGFDEQALLGKIAGALDFDGVNDMVQTAASDTLLMLSADYTTSVWINPNPVQKTWAGIFTKTNATGSLNHWNLQFNNEADRKVVIYHGNSSWDTGIRLADVAGSWHHIAIVRSGTNMTSYLDGSVVRSQTFSSNPVAASGHLNIGADRTATTAYLYTGQIDDLRVYERALTLSEVLALYGLGGA